MQEILPALMVVYKVNYPCTISKCFIRERHVLSSRGVEQRETAFLLLKIFMSLPAIRAECPCICLTDVFRTLHWHLLAIQLLILIRLHVPEISDQIFMD